jgi:hypothetical protein
MNPNWLQRIFGKYEEPAKPPVMCGIYRSGNNLILADPDSTMRGVKIVTVPHEFRERYYRAAVEWRAMQVELAALPRTLRPRRKRAAKVEAAAE